jgi:hypothetical protein
MAVTPSDQYFGIADEVTYGTRVAPSRFFPVIEQSFSYSKERIESEGVVAGLDIIGSDQWNGGPISVEADLGMELYQDHIGLLLKHMFGAVSTTGTVHTFTPGAIDDLSFTSHFGVAPVEGAALIPVELVGCKVTDWEIACSADEIATLGLTTVARDAHFGTRTITDGTTATNTTVTSATALFSNADKGKLITGTGIAAGSTIASVQSATSVTLSAATTATATGVTMVIGAPVATPSYGTLAATPFKFNHASVTYGGGAYPVTDLTITGTNALKTDRRFLGSELISEPLRTGRREFGIQLGREYRDLTPITVLKAGATAAVVTTFSTESGANSLVITANCRIDEASSSFNAMDLNEEPITFKAVRSSTTNASAITAVLTSASATV